jgi:hypothetical protein
MQGREDVLGDVNFAEAADEARASD